MTIPIRGPSWSTPLYAFDVAVERGARRHDFLREYLDALYADAATVGIRADVLVAQWDLETASGTSTYWTRDGNPAGLAAFDDGSNWGLTFTPAKAARAHVTHMCRYAGVPVPDGWIATDARWDAAAPYAGTVSTTAHLGNGRWATDPHYGSKIEQRHAAYSFTPPKEGIDMAAYKAHTFPGLSRPVYLPADIKVSIEIVPSSRTNIRSNAKRSASVVRFMTQHETANFAAGANARMHRNWLHSGASGAYVGFNAVNDDREVIVLTPYDEVTWAAGTATGNLTGDHHELCVNAGIDHVKARRIAAALAAGVLYARGLPVSSLIQHNYWTGKDCPYLLRREGRWAPYVAKVTEFYNGIKAQVEGGAKPEPQKPEYATAEKIAAVADNRPFVALDNKSILVRADVIVRATKSTPRLKYATPKSEHIGPLIGAGETFAVDYLIVNPDQSLYWYTPWGTRVAFADTEIVEAEDVAGTLASVLSAAVES